MKRKEGLPPKTRFSIWSFLIAFLLVMYLQQYFFSSKIETVSYRQFKQKVAEDAVSKVIIGPESITGTLKGKEGRPDQQFSAVRVDDPDLVRELDERKIDYSGRFDNKLVGSILSWILPFGIMLLIWRYAMKKMGPGAGVMSFGKSKAKLFAQNETKVTFADVAGIDVMELSHQRVRNILSGRRQVLDDLAHLLSEKEIVQAEELRTMLAVSGAETDHEKS